MSIARKLAAFEEALKKISNSLSEPSLIIEDVNRKAADISKRLVTSIEALTAYNNQLLQLSGALEAGLVSKDQQPICFAALIDAFGTVHSFRKALIQLNNDLYSQVVGSADLSHPKKMLEKLSGIQKDLVSFKKDYLGKMTKSEKGLLDNYEKFVEILNQVATAQVEMKDIKERDKKTASKIQKEGKILPTQCSDDVSAFNQGVETVSANLQLIMKKYNYIPSLAISSAFFQSSDAGSAPADKHDKSSKNKSKEQKIKA